MTTEIISKIGRISQKYVLVVFVMLFSACGIVPIVENQSSSDDIFFEELVDVEENPPVKSESNVMAATPQPMMLAEIRPIFESSRGYWLAAIEYLQKGEEEDAKWALEEALVINPGSEISNKLLIQIQADASLVLGSEYFDYVVQNGDSLSKLAKIYLHDPMQFYILAKYNEISNPSRLNVGEKIKIPGKKPEVPVVVDVPPVSSPLAIFVDVSTTPTILDEVTHLFQNESYENIISLLEFNDELSHIDGKIKKMLLESYYARSQQFLKMSETVEARKYLLKAVELEPDNVKVNMALINMGDLVEAQELVNKSQLAFSENKLVLAYDLVNQALSLQPDFLVAIAQKKEIGGGLVLFYYKQALMSQRRQELNKAIGYWDKVLVLDSDNENAKLYRAKSIALKEKLKKFVTVS